MKRGEALALPHWEFRSLLTMREKIRARDYADMMLAVNAGFNGDSGYHKRLTEFSQVITPASIEYNTKEDFMRDHGSHYDESEYIEL